MVINTKINTAIIELNKIHIKIVHGAFMTKHHEKLCYNLQDLNNICLNDILARHKVQNEEK